MQSLIYFLISIKAFCTFTSDRILIKEIFGPQNVVVIDKKNKEKILSAGDTVFVGQIIRTKDRQIVVLESYDHSLFKLAPNSELKLEKRVADTKNFSYWVYQLIKGYIWGKVIPLDDSQKSGFKLKIKSKVASMGVRGTEYLYSANSQEASLDVLEGTVVFGQNDQFIPGTFVEVKAGEHSGFQEGKLVKPEPSSKKGTELLRKYELVWTESELQTAARAEEKEPADCYAKGEGWRSNKGNSRGECFKEKFKDED